ncbi:substrate-binding and VWA domain-containing protein [Kutzneria sp. NPDC051319]|uniref:substrate-binding and VWA domain-containing protein n=1 Tax=Kutzneria sp. NPDC051319 TaxID=3155047 RepID=UPI0034440112
MRRHRRGSRRGRFVLPVLVAVLAVGAVVTANASNAARTCGGELPLRVTVTPAMEQVTRQAADGFERDHAAVNGTCVKVEVVAEQSADVVAELPTKPIDPPALWIPDSQLWASTAAEKDAAVPGVTPKISARGSLATSPLVVVGGQDEVAKLGWPQSSVSWKRLVDPDVPVDIADPLTNTEGIATLGLAEGMAPAQNGTPPPELIATLLRLRDSTQANIDTCYQLMARNPATAPLFTATEQSVIAHNAGSKVPAVALYPTEGSVLFDYPVVRVSTAAEPGGTSAAADAFERRLRSDTTAKSLSEAGFREPGGRAAWSMRQGVRMDTPNRLPTPTTTQVATVLRAWDVIHLDGRTLAVIDTSGSMAEPMPDGQSRIDVARDGALAGMSLMPDTTSVGLWTFAEHANELVPLGPLGGRTTGSPQRQALQQAAVTLPTLVGGNTALYDTALQAYQTLRDGYDATKVNSEVLITDGKNETTGGLDLDGLVAALRAQVDPTRPIQIIGIGLGPDADMNVLHQLATATGGQAYQALSGADFRSVLFDALSRRPCATSNC